MEESNDTQWNKKLRERSLRFWLALQGSFVILETVDKSTVSGILHAVDGTQDLLQISQLQTPMFQYPEAIIRTSDLNLIEVNENQI